VSGETVLLSESRGTDKYDVQCMYVSDIYASPPDFQADPIGRGRIPQVPVTQCSDTFGFPLIPNFRRVHIYDRDHKF
jgi:hypothetical protein